MWAGMTGMFFKKEEQFLQQYRKYFCWHLFASLPNSKPSLLSILHRSPDKSDFIKDINVFTETRVLDNQEC